MIEAHELHVLPHAESGRWLVGPAPGSAVSWHRTAGEAEVAARRLAAMRGMPRIYVHDLYQRVRAIRTR